MYESIYLRTSNLYKSSMSQNRYGVCMLCLIYLHMCNCSRCISKGKMGIEAKPLGIPRGTVCHLQPSQSCSFCSVHADSLSVLYMRQQQDLYAAIFVEFLKQYPALWGFRVMEYGDGEMEPNYGRLFVDRYFDLPISSQICGKYDRFNAPQSMMLRLKGNMRRQEICFPFLLFLPALIKLNQQNNFSTKMHKHKKPRYIYVAQKRRHSYDTSIQPGN